MKTASSDLICPQCHTAIPADAPQGLCPRCALAAAAAGTLNSPEPKAEDVPANDQVAALFPQLEILGLIGRGGMGLVYKARQPRLDRLVALKLLPRHLAVDPLFAERFNREGRVLAKLSHPNIVTVYDFGNAGDFFYLLMEYVEGMNLRQAMREGRLSPAAALAIVPKICEALQYAHDQGILHRDIKPENILTDRKGTIKIADFGIAKLVGEDRDPLTLTNTGAALGTLHYMAPEQLENPKGVDHRADIYSLGVVFYEMLTGHLPIGRFAPPSSRTTLDQRIDEIVLRALERERELRQKSAREMKTEVEDFAAVRPAHCEATAKETATVVSPSGSLTQNPVTHRRPGRTGPILIWASAAFLLAGGLGWLLSWPGASGPKSMPVAVRLPSLDAAAKDRQDQAYAKTVQLAEQRVEDARAQWAAGKTSTGAVLQAVRDLAQLRARGDNIALARAELEYRELLLTVARNGGDDAALWTAELGRAEAWHALAVAQARGNKVSIARADREYAESVYVLAQRHHQRGTVDEKRLRAAQRDFAQADSYLKQQENVR